MYPEENLQNNSQIGVQFDQEKVTDSTKTYMVVNNNRSFLIRFLKNHGIVDEDDTATWILIGFSLLFIIAAIIIFLYSTRETGINLNSAIKPTLNENVKTK